MSYLRRLPSHPGFSLAMIYSVTGFIAGGPIGALIMSVFWIPVLITNGKDG